MAVSREKFLASAKDMLAFINKSPSPFHAVDEVKKSLHKFGFQELRETERWTIAPMQKYYVTKNESTIIAFAVGGQFKPGNGFSIVGAHTDSPCLKVKPVSAKTKVGFCQVGVECYGGGIWNTWFDRDLTVAGRVLVKDLKSDSIKSHLVNLERPILRIPHLAIHLQRDMNDSFGANKENHLVPILATCAQAELQGDKIGDAAKGSETEQKNQASKHSPTLVRLICEKLNIDPGQMMDFELCLADTQAGAVGGACEEFVFSPRLDNLFNAYTGTQGLLNSLSDGSLETDTNIRMISLFDNEEVGSQSAQGAASTFQETVMRRISAGGTTAFEESVAKSYMISADQAHGCHPNYVEKHEANHQPIFHKGIVIKFNANQRYATTSVTATILREIAKKMDVPLQDIVVRNDSACGSTIGPIMSAKLGMQTIDVGAAQFAMHSIREMGGVDDVLHSINLFESFFRHYPSVQERIILNQH